ncbi:tRNA pseudouridine(55) synthase TruB [Reinekea marinisedimentorum]|uniref:tRNA pseudouridine synthase B n=1 Tax=Reinekea marinisedimentorum TaxID=230495 RepID=A0A4R3HYC9_9GAMM|nr:tRNA pseudouridine(55) synthase TruB [Reinekea marinisedimentorum]TCS38218.1 tRNA pseudouridine55 synthase [Reinekea marinisedimentorum]
MARKRKGRAIDGVVLVDKPAGFSSNGLLQKIRWIYQAQKAGHTGALDPAATGLLPICFGEATKFTRYLLDSDKRYLTTGVLGICTDTLDAEGEVVAEAPVPAVQQKELEALIAARFTGDIEQIPPMYSALKRDGKKLYELARQGETIELEPRPVTIYENRVQGLSEPEFSLSVHCSKGTYIRTLVANIGDAIGCGAHVKSLRRTSHGPFQLADAHTVDALEALREQEDFQTLDSYLISIDELLGHLPRVDLNEKQSRLFSHGNDIQFEPVVGEARVYSSTGAFLGVGEGRNGQRLQPVRLVAKRDSE